MPRPRFRVDIQGLRGIAVVAVIADHAGAPWAAGGYVGVDVFFVISGFLITGQLLDRLRSGGARLADFYVRRMRRLLPAALTVLTLTAVASVFCLPRTMLPGSLGDAAAAAAYVPNLMLAARGTDYLADTTPSLYQHYWSLGAEEQFYLVWPVLLAGALWAASSVRQARRQHVAFAAILAAVAAASFALSLHETRVDQPWAFFPMWTRAWEFGAGALVAVAVDPIGRRMPARLRSLLGWLGLAGIVTAIVGFDAATEFPGTAALLPVLAAAALITAGSGEAAGHGPAAALGGMPLQFLGRISYALYLVHWPLLQLVQAHAGYDAPLALWERAALALLAVPLAWALHRFVEVPLRYARPAPGAGPRVPHAKPLLAGLAASALVGAVAVGGASVAAAAPLHSGRTATDRALSAPPTPTTFVPSTMRPTLTGAADDNPPMYADGCELGFLASVPRPCTFGADGLPRLVLFGDSHAAEWQPALAAVAEREGYQLVTHTKSSCRSVLEQQPGDLARDRACTAWRDAVLDDLAARPPAVVVLANFASAPTSRATDASTHWSSGVRSTVAALHASRVIVLADTPDLGHSPIPCLSRHLTDAQKCSVPAAEALTSVGRASIKRAVAATRADYVDLTGYLCGASCPAIIGNTLVYRDDNHITATFSAQLATPLDAVLRPLLSE